MYKLPSLNGVTECVINSAVIEKGMEPLILFHQEVKSA
jgi:ATP-dependent Clp protease ATP-binding subunit ClpX